jgi:translation initiation factor 2 subunit 1
MDKTKGIEALSKAIAAIESTITQSGGQIVVKMKPKAVSETDDQELDALMKKSEMENTEVAGDEDVSD